MITPSTSLDFLWGLPPKIVAPAGWKLIAEPGRWLFIESPEGARYFACGKLDRITRAYRFRIATEEDVARTAGELELGEEFCDDRDVMWFTSSPSPSLLSGQPRIV